MKGENCSTLGLESGSESFKSSLHTCQTCQSNSSSCCSCSEVLPFVSGGSSMMSLMSHDAMEQSSKIKQSRLSPAPGAVLTLAVTPTTTPQQLGFPLSALPMDMIQTPSVMKHVTLPSPLKTNMVVEEQDEALTDVTLKSPQPCNTFNIHPSSAENVTAAATYDNYKASNVAIGTMDPLSGEFDEFQRLWDTLNNDYKQSVVPTLTTTTSAGNEPSLRLYTASAAAPAAKPSQSAFKQGSNASLVLGSTLPMTMSPEADFDPLAIINDLATLHSPQLQEASMSFSADSLSSMDDILMASLLGEPSSTSSLYPLATDINGTSLLASTMTTTTPSSKDMQVFHSLVGKIYTPPASPMTPVRKMGSSRKEFALDKVLKLAAAAGSNSSLPLPIVPVTPHIQQQQQLKQQQQHHYVLLPPEMSAHQSAVETMGFKVFRAEKLKNIELEIQDAWVSTPPTTKKEFADRALRLQPLTPSSSFSRPAAAATDGGSTTHVAGAPQILTPATPGTVTPMTPSHIKQLDLMKPTFRGGAHRKPSPKPATTLRMKPYIVPNTPEVTPLIRPRPTSLIAYNSGVNLALPPARAMTTTPPPMMKKPAKKKLGKSTLFDGVFVLPPDDPEPDGTAPKCPTPQHGGAIGSTSLTRGVRSSSSSSASNGGGSTLRSERDRRKAELDERMRNLSSLMPPKPESGSVTVGVVAAGVAGRNSIGSGRTFDDGLDQKWNPEQLMNAIHDSL